MGLRQRWRAWHERTFGVRCHWCGGKGRTYGYSPLDSLSTYRTPCYMRCRHCTDGYMTPEQVAADRKYEEFWTSGRYREGDVTLAQLDRGDWI